MVPFCPRLAVRRPRCAGFGILLAAWLSAPLGLNAGAPEAQPHAALDTWLATQTNLITWSAGFRQTRTLRTLTEPLTATGRVWFASPDRFRWEVGDPPQTIAVRQPDRVWILYPRFRRAERYPIGPESIGPWKDAMALLDAGFPRSRAELDRRFHLRSLTATGSVHQLTLEPRSPKARRFMPEIRLEFALTNAALLATEMRFMDGSRLRNDFFDVQTNTPIEPARFDPAVPADWRISEPAAR